jgi:hypothetical protein
MIGGRECRGVESGNRSLASSRGRPMAGVCRRCPRLHASHPHDLSIIAPRRVGVYARTREGCESTPTRGILVNISRLGHKGHRGSHFPIFRRVSLKRGPSEPVRPATGNAEQLVSRASRRAGVGVSADAVELIESRQLDETLRSDSRAQQATQIQLPETSGVDRRRLASCDGNGSVRRAGRLTTLRTTSGCACRRPRAGNSQSLLPLCESPC